MLVYLVRNGFPVTDFWFISRSWTLQIMFGQSASLNTWEGIIDLKVVGYHNLPLNYLWSDVFVSEDLRSYRWMHLDPCEGIYDKPLLYEKGYYSFMQYFHFTVFIAIIHLIESEKIVVLVLIRSLHLASMFPHYYFFKFVA